MMNWPTDNWIVVIVSLVVLTATVLAWIHRNKIKRKWVSFFKEKKDQNKVNCQAIVVWKKPKSKGDWIREWLRHMKKNMKAIVLTSLIPISEKEAEKRKVPDTTSATKTGGKTSVSKLVVIAIFGIAILLVGIAWRKITTLPTVIKPDKPDDGVLSTPENNLIFWISLSVTLMIIGVLLYFRYKDSTSEIGKKGANSIFAFIAKIPVSTWRLTTSTESLRGNWWNLSRTIFCVFLVFAGLNLVVLYLWHFMSGTWHDGFSRSQFVWTLVVGILLITLWATKKHKGVVPPFRTFLFAIAFLFCAFLFGYVPAGEIGSKIAQGAAKASALTEEKTPEKKLVGGGWVSWRFPPGMDNPLYPRNEKGSLADENKVAKVIRNDSEVFEIIVYSKYGGELRHYYWDRAHDKVGRFWTKGNAVGRKSDSGEWHLEPTKIPGFYKGAWWSQNQTRGEPIDLELQMR